MALLLNFFGTKVAAALLGGWVLFGHSPKGPTLSPPLLASSGGKFVVSSALKNAFPEELDQVLLTGTPVTLVFTAALLDDTKVLQEQNVYHTAAYDPGIKVFSFSEGGVDRTTTNLDTLQAWMGTLTGYPLAEVSTLRPEGRYQVTLQAKLEAIAVEAMEGKKFDLMTLWSFRVPKARSEVLPGTALLGHP